MKKLTVPSDLGKLGFAPAKSDRDHVSIAACTCGMEGSGKTEWACRGPEPVTIVTFDPGTGRVVTKLRREGLEIYESVVEMPVPTKNKEHNRKVFGPIWDKVENQLAGIAESASMSGGTVVIDTATELRELARLAILGGLKQVGQFSYGDVNDKLRPLCKAIIYRADLNSVWIHKVGKVYVRGADGSGVWNGKYERRGFDDLSYLCDLVTEHEFDKRKGRFLVKVDLNKEWMEMTGQTLVVEDDGAGPGSFVDIALETFPETKEGDWVRL